MKCPACGFEPRDRLLHQPCPACQHVWWDTEAYVRELARPLHVQSSLDIGCGNKGIIAQVYWDERGVKVHACDRYVLKPLPPSYVSLLMDAEGLPEQLPDGVDFVTHCGMLEHIAYDKALRVLHAVEQVARKRVFFTCSAVLRDVDYKVKRDGNPYHYYLSWWDAKAFETLGYLVDRVRMKAKETFHEEVICAFDPSKLKAPWEVRVEALKKHLVDRRCCREGCPAEPFAWNALEDGDRYYCLVHWLELGTDLGDAARWLARDDIAEKLSFPPWRERLLPVLK